MRQFEQSIGGIARTVAGSAGGLRQAASMMRDSAITAGQRTLAVSTASDQASQSVSTAAAGAEEVAISVGEIARQVAEFSPDRRGGGGRGAGNRRQCQPSE